MLLRNVTNVNGQADFPTPGLAGVAGTAALLIYEHRLVKPGDLSRVNQAFFTVNGCVSFLILGATAADLALRG